MNAIVLYAIILLPSFIQASWPYIPFDISMKKDKELNIARTFAITEQIIGLNGQALYDFFKKTYENNAHAQKEESLKIPKIIHQIWLGSPLPEEFKQLQNSWIEHHTNKGWSYKLWTDEDVAQLKLYNQEFYDATDNYGVKSDILRWELLHRYGGVYIDMDYECLQPLDDLHYTYDFYTALQPLDTLFVQLGAALVGSRAGHPILAHCIETIKDDWGHKGAPKKTGPVHFTKSFCAMANKEKDSRDIAFPASYFYPLGSQEQTRSKSTWIQEGAFAVHWWAKSWMPKSYRPALSRSIDNEASAQSWND